ncbi:hypothetical protein ACJMK2_002330, partial [Sinanodonta woodiana]
ELADIHLINLLDCDEQQLKWADVFGIFMAQRTTVYKNSTGFSTYDLIFDIKCIFLLDSTLDENKNGKLPASSQKDVMVT